MSSLFGVLNIAQSGLNAQSAGLQTTGQNVSNVNTPGYVRRNALLETDASGSGVNAVGVQRQVNAFTLSRLVTERSQLGAANARGSGLAQVEGIVAPSGATVSDQMNAFFAAADALSANPSDTSARQNLLAKAGDLAQNISSTASSLGDTSASLLTQAKGIAGEVNDRLTRIASLNGQIADATARGDGAADLRDQRDTLVSDVADRIGARSVEDASGRITLFAAGTALVSGDTASSIDVGLDASGGMKVDVKRAGGTVVDATAGVTSGSLGGIREARDVDLKNASTKLDQLAFDFGNAVNAVHASGFGLDGVSGRALFTTSATVTGAARAFSVDAAMIGHPEKVAAAKSASDVPGGNDAALALSNVGTASLAGGSPPATRFGEIATDIGVAKSTADSDSSLRTETVAQAQSLNDSASGVSLDEEMANMSRFQNAFEASTKVLSTVNDLLDGLMKAF